MRESAPTASLYAASTAPGGREGGLNGDLRRFTVTDLADHDDVRVLPQHVFEHLAKDSPICSLTWSG